MMTMALRYEVHIVNDYKRWYAHWLVRKYRQEAALEYWFPTLDGKQDSKRYAIDECKRWTEQQIKRLDEPRLVSCMKTDDGTIVLRFYKRELEGD